MFRDIFVIQCPSRKKDLEHTLWQTFGGNCIFFGGGGFPPERCLEQTPHYIYRPLIFVELLAGLSVRLRVAGTATRVRRRRLGRDAPCALLLPADRYSRRRYEHAARRAGEQQHALVLVELAEQFADARVLLRVEPLQVGDLGVALAHLLLQLLHHHHVRPAATPPPRCELNSDGER